jgi:tetratricopeptide (TPR) repeat protein
MFRKNYFTILLMSALFLVGSVAAFAQTAPVSGSVILTKADGTKVPVQGASIEVYRTDVGGKLPAAKTNKKGEFTFVALPLGGVFTLAISGPGISPIYIPNIKAGAERLVFSVSEGDGRKLTEAEVRSGASTASTNSTTNTSTSKELTAEQKKQQEEEQKKIAEVSERNKKVENDNEVLQSSMKAGNDAYNSKNYDLAIAEYDKGIQAKPTFVGSAPSFLNNKAVALSDRGVELYNQSVKMTDKDAKAQASAKVTKDFGDAIDAYNASWTVLKNAPAGEITNQQNFDNNKKQTLSGVRSVVKYIIQTEKFDSSKVSTISTLLTEYLAFETDAVKKTEAEVFLGDIYRIGGDSANAIAEYKKVLEKSPSNMDALAGLGLSQANAGYNADGTINDEMMQQAINNLQKFSDTAPENHKLKISVKEAVDYLKTQNFKPQKSTGKKKS